MEPDGRRKNEGQRTRIDEIGTAYVNSLDSMRRWLKRITIFIALISVAGLIQTPVFYAALQGQRLRATRESCLFRNDQAYSTIRLLIRLKAQPEAIQSARSEYPQEADCEGYAQARVSSVLGIVFLAGPPIVTPPPPPLTGAELKFCGDKCVR